MVHASEPAHLVLLGLRLKGFAEPDAITGITGQDLTEVTAVLGELQQSRLVTHRDGRISGWTLTPEGRSEGERMVATEVEAHGVRAAIESAFEGFMAVNQEFLQVCTDWQLRDSGSSQVPNDHSDPAYDKTVIGRLTEIDGRIAPVCEALSEALDRFGTYRPRLANALARVQDGDPDYFAKPLIDSYHTIWFELHEDLLLTLGRERTA